MHFANQNGCLALWEIRTSLRSIDFARVLECLVAENKDVRNVNCELLSALDMELEYQC